MGTLHTRTNADSSREAVQSARGKLPSAKISVGPPSMPRDTAPKRVHVAADLGQARASTLGYGRETMPAVRVERFVERHAG
jgi:hypothetical protein